MSAPTFPNPDFVIRVRDKFLNVLGELDDYQGLELRLRWNDISTWQLTLHRTQRLVQDLSQPGAGIIVHRVGTEEAILTGPWTEESHDQDGDKNTVTYSGVDDTVWLTRRLTYTDPADIVPPYPDLEDLRTDVASTNLIGYVNSNLGSSAPAARKVFGLVTAADPVVGATITNSGRWQSMLLMCQNIAKTSEAIGLPISFDVKQTVFSGSNVISFSVSEVEDVTSTVRFSRELGNMASFSYKRTAPEINYAIVGGEGEGTARTFYEKPDSPSIAEWGRIEGDLIDSRNGSSGAELDQAAAEALNEGKGTTSLAITPIDTADQQYGVHYGLGSKVTVVFDLLGGAAPGTTPNVVQDIVREVAITITPESSKITPAIGTQGIRASTTKIFKSLRALKGRVVNLERI